MELGQKRGLNNSQILLQKKQQFFILFHHQFIKQPIRNEQQNDDIAT